MTPAAQATSPTSAPLRCRAWPRLSNALTGAAGSRPLRSRRCRHPSDVVREQSSADTATQALARADARAGVLAWLEGVGVIPGAPADGAKVPNVVVSKLPSASHGGPRKPGKRRAADGGAEGPAKRRAKGGHDEGGVSYEVIVSYGLTLPVGHRMAQPCPPLQCCMHHDCLPRTHLSRRLL